MRPKPVKNVKTFDAREHEVDIRMSGKAYTAWGFVDGRLIEGPQASTQDKAVVGWAKEYKTVFAAATAK